MPISPAAGFVTPPPQTVPYGSFRFGTPSTSISKSAQKESPDIKIEIFEKIGSGSFGDVYSAAIAILSEDDEWEEYDCAAKHINVYDSSTDEFSTQEKLAQDQLASAESGIIKPICRKEVDGKLYEFYATGVMNLEKCKSRIAEFISPDITESKEAYSTFHAHLVIDFFDSMIRILKTLKKEDMVHADIKPANLVYRYNPVLPATHNGIKTSGWCAIDFGCTTKSGTLKKLMGTPRYMALEINTSRDYSSAADIYAFGLILKELMGCKPEATENKNKVHFSQEEMIRDASLETRFHDCLKKIIDYMAQPCKSDRPTLETIKILYPHLQSLLPAELRSNEICQYYSELSEEIKIEEAQKNAGALAATERSFLSLIAEEQAKESRVLHSQNPNTLLPANTRSLSSKNSNSSLSATSEPKT